MFRKKGCNKNKEEYERIRENWIKVQEEQKAKKLKNVRKTEKNYDDIKREWDILKKEEENKIRNLKKCYKGKNSEDIKRDWEKLREENILIRLHEMEKNKGEIRKITLKKKQKFVKYYKWSLFLEIIFLLGGIGNDIMIFLFCIYEFFNAPIRQLLDAIFNSYTRVEGICVKNEYYKCNKGQEEDTFLITILYSGGMKKQKVLVKESVNIRVGQRISVIKGKLSRRVINIENYNCDIEDYI